MYNEKLKKIMRTSLIYFVLVGEIRTRVKEPQNVLHYTACFKKPDDIFMFWITELKMNRFLWFFGILNPDGFIRVNG